MNLRTVFMATACISCATAGGDLKAAPPSTVTAPAPAKWGTITGQVHDNQGRLLVGVLLLLNETREATKTDSNGMYMFTGEEARIWTVTAQTPDYQKLSLTLTVQPGATNRMDMELEHYPNWRGRQLQAIPGGVKSIQPIINVLLSQDQRMLLSSFPGDSGLHSTARSSR